MSQLFPFVRAFEALGRAFHSVAEDRMEREGKVPPAKFPDKTAAYVLGSMAQGFEAAAIDLRQQIAQDLGRNGPLEPRPEKGE
jgi:hypothetical protein